MGPESKPQVLIVDDEPAIRLSYRLILQQHGYEVAVADGSDSARAQMQTREFDLLMCDMGLERPFSGMDVVQWAREHFPNMPCILVTGYPDDEISERARKVGVHMLYKPVEVPKLLETIDFMLRLGKPRAAD